MTERQLEGITPCKVQTPVYDIRTPVILSKLLGVQPGFPGPDKLVYRTNIYEIISSRSLSELGVYLAQETPQTPPTDPSDVTIGKDWVATDQAIDMTEDSHGEGGFAVQSTPDKFVLGTTLQKLGTYPGSIMA